MRRDTKLMIIKENRDGGRDAPRKRGQEPLTNYAMSQPANTQTGSGLPLCDTTANQRTDLTDHRALPTSRFFGYLFDASCPAITSFPPPFSYPSFSFFLLFLFYHRRPVCVLCSRFGIFFHSFSQFFCLYTIFYFHYRVDVYMIVKVLRPRSLICVSWNVCSFDVQSRIQTTFGHWFRNSYAQTMNVYSN